MNSVPIKPVNLTKEESIDVLYDTYEYFLLRSYPNTFTKDVNDAIKKGWKLYGDFKIVEHGMFCQALIKKLPAVGGNRTRRNRYLQSIV
jgi:hypothetical protein